MPQITDESKDFFNELHVARLDIVKEVFELLGFDLGESKPNIEYHNYMDSGFVGGSVVPLDIFDNIHSGIFTGAGKGKLNIPPKFYSDKILFDFLTKAEGDRGLQWVSEYKGHEIVRSAACFGYDWPGGIHDPSYIKKLGLTAEAGDALGIIDSGREPIGAETYNGKVKWGWKTNSIPADHPYWKKLIPLYRDAMIWAWNQPGIQSIRNPAERLARMHTINWYGHHNMKGLTHNDVGWNHRLKVANSVCKNIKLM